MIPRIIHYCWFGNKKKPHLIRKCINSWKQIHPDWVVIEWNESNYDVNKIPYIKEAYEKKKWAFVVDYARFDILNEYGGIFLDTDVELLKRIPDELLQHEAFTGFESIDKVAPGLIYASIPKQKLLADIMNIYESKNFSLDENIVSIVTGILKSHGLRCNNTFQSIDGVAVYPSDFFCCYDFETQSFSITPETISIHHYFASWFPWYKKMYFKCIKYAAIVLGKERYMKLKRKLVKRAEE